MVEHSDDRWQGQIEARLNEVERRTDHFSALYEAITALRVEVATLRAQVRFWSAIGSSGMVGMISLVVALLIKG